MIELPDCCMYCGILIGWEFPKDKCNPEHYMAALIEGKCPEFGLAYPQKDNPGAYKYAMKKHRLEPENDTAS